MDISQVLKLKPRKLKLTKQVKLIQLMNSLFSSGFHLGEVVNFLKRSQLVELAFVEKMENGLLSGKNLSAILSDLNFSSNVVTQISLAEHHGNLGQTLDLVEKNLRKSLSIKNKLIQIATYPILLVVFLVFIMLGLKNYLLPQLGNQSNSAVEIINHLPQIAGATTLILGIAIGYCYWKIKHSSALLVFEKISRLPLLGSLIKLYLTGYFSREWGNLISQGLELRQIFQIMENQSSKIFRETGQSLLISLHEGQEFYQAVSQFNFFSKELSLMIEYGEAKAKLGTELNVYAEESWEKFFFKIDKLMQFIQPMIFLLVALMIVMLYAAMLLPIYQNMSTFK